MNLKKVAVVTGGGSGIGRATAMALGNAGAKVAVVDVVDAGEDVAGSIRSAGGEALFARCDVSQSNEVLTSYELVARDLGAPTILVNCAGILGLEVDALNVGEDELRRVFEVNFFGVFYWSRAVVPSMCRAGWGRVVTLSSVARHGAPRHAPYAVSKAAVSSFMRTLALETARSGVLANCVEPGRTLTGMVVPRFPVEHLENPPDAPIGRYAEPEEIAAVIVFLCSEASSYATGQTFAVSGGAFT